MSDQSSFDEEDVTPAGAEELQSANVFPWPPSEDESLVDAFVQTWKGASFHPSRFFASMPAERPIGPSVLYYLIIGVGVAAIGLFWNLVLPQPEMDPSAVPTALSMAESISPLVGFLLSPVIQIMALFIGAGITHLMLLMLTTERGTYGRTVRIYSYTTSPTLLCVLVPYAGAFIGAIWALVIAVIGLREAHRTTTARAVMAVLLPGVFIGILGFILAMVVLAVGISAVK